MSGEGRLRRIRHPGPVAPVRHAKARGRLVPLRFRVEAGEAMEAGLGRGVLEAGCASAYVSISGARMEPFRYVMPAGSPGPSHAAWYSEIYAPKGGVHVQEAGAIIGERDGAPFVHCHGLWRAAGADIAMGHMLPNESFAGEAVTVTGFGLKGAAFRSREDAETNFRLFSAEGTGAAVPNGPLNDHRRAFAITLRPNQDVSEALEAIAAECGFDRAAIYGIGSLNGARFETGPAMDSYASELLIRDGRLEKGRVRLDVAVVAMDGRIFEGVLRRGENPVCVTFEIVLVPDA
ncbi:DUF296 domain-containing protein [Fulvimarina sp. MAC3]|uniref:PCC domain-containing protein n=1 Tax=Fulvimarina sp. MAC3 TaxID=3148887 RepID=UPI0031FC2BE5